MGDKIEINTHHGESITYKVPEGGLKVDIKVESGSGSPAIGLKRAHDEDHISYWIVIGYENKTWIEKDGNYKQVVQSPRILSYDGEYRSFWISWNSKHISVGRDGEVDPIIAMIDNCTKELNFVLFTVEDENASVRWRFELPPLIPNPELKPLNDGDVQWVRAENQLPDGALIGGYENGPLYIIRAEHNQSLSPGKGSLEGVGYITWESEIHEKTDIEVLVGFNCTWVPITYRRGGDVPVGAVVGGYVEQTKEKLYIGRVEYKGHLIIGKVQPSNSVCYTAYEGREISHHDFEVLVAPNASVRFDNEILIYVGLVDSPPSDDEELDDDND